MPLNQVMVFVGSASQLTLFLSTSNMGALDVSKGELIRRMSSYQETLQLLCLILMIIFMLGLIQMNSLMVY